MTDNKIIAYSNVACDNLYDEESQWWIWIDKEHEDLINEVLK